MQLVEHFGGMKWVQHCGDGAMGNEINEFEFIMAAFEQFLTSFDANTKGFQFECFVKWFLVNDPEWATQVDQVWMWDEYPERWGRDCGIDLIFKHINGEIWAVQAKCYAPEYSITKSDVDTFLSESNRTGIDKRLLIATTDKVGANAKQVCNAQEKAVTLFLYSNFEQAAIEYPDHISNIHLAKRKERPSPRIHQLKAIDDVELAFKGADRGQLIMACGTGKTFTTFWIKERLDAHTTLVLLPSLSLLSQTLREWTFASHTPFHALCVCSDETVGKKSGDDAIIGSIQDVSFPTTSDAQEVSEFLKVDGNKVIFSTYHSSPVIAEAQENHDVPTFDLVIADEAHRCTGEIGKAFSTILDQTKIRAKKRLFATATPRTYSANLKKNASERGVNVTGMDDETVFGSVFHTLTFGEAIEAELLTDYQVVIIGVDQPMVAKWIENRELFQTEAGDVVDAKSLASQIGLIKAIRDYDLKRMISFHSRVKGAETFASKINQTIHLIGEEHRPAGDLWTGTVSGKMTAHQRKLKLDQLKKLDNSDRGLLSNARCLSEGVDVPSLDGVVFIDPKSSQIDIVQAVGRAIRLSEDKKIGAIILPVFIEDGADIEASLQSSHFKPVWYVLNALKSHDEVLSFELDQYRSDLGRNARSSNLNRSIPKVTIDLPQTIDPSFANALKTQLVEQTTSSWEFWFGLLEFFIEEEGHAKVSSNYKTDDGYKLGQWVISCRAKRDQLTPERESRLESLNGWVWNTLDAAWEEGFNYLKEYIDREGHAFIPQSYKTDDGYNLGTWIGTQRNSRDQLTPERESRLESLNGWVWNVLDAAWEEGFNHLKEYADRAGHAKIPQSYKTDDGYKLGYWAGYQRNKRDKLTPERKSRLESLNGWVWNALDAAWEEGFNYLKEYVDKEGHANIPQLYKTDDGYNLGSWVAGQRSKNRDQLTPERESRLEALNGWVWNGLDALWKEGFNHLKEYVDREGHARVPKSYKTDSGYKLGQWVGVRRTNRDQLTEEKELSLESLNGWVWDVLDAAWEEGFEHLITHIEEEGHAKKIPKLYKTGDGYNLGSWINTQRGKRDKLTPEREARLEALDGWVWNVTDSSWEEGFSHLVTYLANHGDANVPSSYKTESDYNLGRWVGRQRGARDKLSLGQISRLESLNGWAWDKRDALWEEGFAHLVTYTAKYAGSNVPCLYKTECGYKLGQWAATQRSKMSLLTKERISRLESLNGWAWNTLDAAWEEGFNHLKEYIDREGHARVPRPYKTESGYKLGQWVLTRRTRRNQLTKERESRLESLNGWVWNILDAAWEKGFSHLFIFIEQEGHSSLPQSYKAEDGYNLGGWVSNQRNKRAKLSLERKSKLELLDGWVWETK